MLINIQNFINPTGGLFYHYLGLKYSKRLWKQTRELLSQELSHWLMNKKKLIIIGPSAGYLFNSETFSQLTELTLIDTDPLALYLFKLKHKCPQKTQSFTQDGIGIQNGKVNFHSLNIILKNHPDQPILFSNVLGQLPLVAPSTFSHSKQIDEFKLQLQEIVQNRPFFSFHDRLTIKQTVKAKKSCVKSATQLSNNEVIESLVDLSQSLELLDHSTYRLFDHCKSYSYWLWSRTPSEIHITESCYK